MTRDYDLLPVPENREDFPTCFQHIVDGAGDTFVVRWRKPTKFTDGETRRTLRFPIHAFGIQEAERRAWNYFCARFLALRNRRRRTKGVVDLRGFLSAPDEK